MCTSSLHNPWIHVHILAPRCSILYKRQGPHNLIELHVTHFCKSRCEQKGESKLLNSRVARPIRVAMRAIASVNRLGSAQTSRPLQTEPCEASSSSSMPSCTSVPWQSSLRALPDCSSRRLSSQPPPRPCCEPTLGVGGRDILGIPAFWKWPFSRQLTP